jgi:hypothetical protein
VGPDLVPGRRARPLPLRLRHHTIDDTDALGEAAGRHLTPTGVEASVLAKASRIDLADSELHAPAAGFGDDEVSCDVFDKAAVLCCIDGALLQVDDGRDARLGATPRSVRSAQCQYAADVAEKSAVAGVLLVVVGIVVTFASESSSATSLIPAFVGAVLIVLGIIARVKPDLSRHLMHAALAVALLAALGSIGSAIGRGSTGWALFAQLATIAVTGVFIFFGVQSFRAARLSRTTD